MKRAAFILVSCAFLISGRSASAEPEKYDIDSAHSAANFSIKHLMISNVKGAFTKVKGVVEYDEKNPKDSKVEATIEMDSVDTHEPNRDTHLKSVDFFDVTKYPTMSFKSTKVVPKGNHLEVTGELNLHGVTKPVTLDVDGPTAEINDPMGSKRRGASAHTTINRKDFGVSWNKNLDNGGVTLGDQVDITIDMEMKKPKAKA